MALDSEGDRYGCDVPPSARLTSRLRFRALLLPKVARDLAGLPFRQRRTSARSIEEYDRRWGSADVRFSGVDDLEEAVARSSYGNRQIHALIEHNPYRVPARDFFLWRARKLTGIFAEHYSRDVPILEVGCGIGKNLMALALGGFSQLYGTDASSEAVRGLQSLSNALRLDIGCAPFNLFGSPAECLAVSRPVIFTNYVLEQMPGRVQEALEKIIELGPREVVHIEPCPQPLYQVRSLLSLANWSHAYRRDYERGLLDALSHLEARGQLKRLEVVPLGFSPHLTHAPILVRWKPM